MFVIMEKHSVKQYLFTEQEKNVRASHNEPLFISQVSVYVFRLYAALWIMAESGYFYRGLGAEGGDFCVMNWSFIWCA